MTEPSRQAMFLALARAGAASGGKAEGLARLMRLKLPVPDGFVIVGAAEGMPLPGLEEAYGGIGGGRVAVRSSAIGEDGGQRSFAGQYETVLGVEGMESLRLAVDRCLASLHGRRAQSYRAAGGEGDRAARMSVVVQRMVEARAAGVLFTADPVLGSRRSIIIDAVRGPGEALVGGAVSPDHYEATRQGEIVGRELQGESPVLSDDEIARLVREALAAERDWGAPLDMEWAIDGRGEPWWLQARPVTALDFDVHEFDHAHGPGDVYTRANIGEMIPGPVCPLTLSTAVAAIDHGIQAMKVACGAQERIEPDLSTVGVFYGHLFFNLTSMLGFCDRVAGSSPRTLALAICGRPVEELGGGNPAPALVRGLNGARYLRYVLRAPGRIAELERKLAAFRLPPLDEAEAMARQIDENLPLLVETYDIHLQSSAGSGLLAGLLEGILSGGGPVTPEHEAALASLLADAGGVESAELVGEIDGIVRALAEHAEARRFFTGASPSEALAWLRGGASGSAGLAFERFLSRHGHRSLRELSMDQPCWEDDPLPLVASLQASQASMSGAAARRRRAGGETQGRAGGILGWLQARSREAIRRREHTKSILVDVTNRFKRAYRHLGRLLAARGALEDEGLLWYLTHGEIVKLAEGRDDGLEERARRRRRARLAQESLEFPAVFTGQARPLAPPGGAPDGESALSGKPVSRGIVEGTARVVRTLEEAAAIRPGEILIAPVTDVGWTPYFGILAGLATDLGSAISHGAVIAREYGLPAIVNLKTASRLFRTGDRVILDADRGILRRVAPTAGTVAEGKERTPCLRSSMS